MNKIISLLFALIILASCGQGGNKTQDASDMEFRPISVSEFVSDAGPFVDEAVKISGTVVHVCRHGGQRLFIIGEEGEDRIRITTGEDIAEFDVALEGETIEVTGIVKEMIIDETYLAEWEAEIVDGTKHDRGEGHEGGVGHGDDHGDADADAEHEDGSDHDEDADQQLEVQLAKIQNVRDEIAESGKDHLSDYWIETIILKVIKE
ncbi:hypothetical protein ACFLSP_03500 [Bacteroidota bacterium]